jgi:hypothetical protein
MNAGNTSSIVPFVPKPSSPVAMQPSMTGRGLMAKKWNLLGSFPQSYLGQMVSISPVRKGQRGHPSLLDLRPQLWTIEDPEIKKSPQRAANDLLHRRKRSALRVISSNGEVMICTESCALAAAKIEIVMVEWILILIDSNQLGKVRRGI